VSDKQLYRCNAHQYLFEYRLDSEIPFREDGMLVWALEKRRSRLFGRCRVGKQPKLPPGPWVLCDTLPTCPVTIPEADALLKTRLAVHKDELLDVFLYLILRYRAARWMQTYCPEQLILGFPFASFKWGRRNGSPSRPLKHKTKFKGQHWAYTVHW
jgi:hypothetical protein